MAKLTVNTTRHQYVKNVNIPQVMHGLAGELIPLATSATHYV